MKIKLFGKNVFEAHKGRGGAIFEMASSDQKDSKYLPDFYTKFGQDNEDSMEELMTLSLKVKESKITKKKKVEKPKKELTPKGVYDLKMLNDNEFQIKADPKYVDEQLEDFKDKL